MTKDEWQKIFRNAIDKASTEEIPEDNYKYIELGDLGPIPREVPNWFRDLAIRFLLDLHAKWKKQASGLGQDYYLKIWLFDKDFGDSQVVFAVKKQITRYLNNFDNSSTQKEIPDLSEESSELLSKYNIEYKKHMGWYYVEDLENIVTQTVIDNYSGPVPGNNYSDIDVSKSVSDNLNYLIKNRMVEKMQVSSHPDPVYKIQTDGVWVIDQTRHS